MVVLRSSDYVAVLVELAREEMLRRRLSIPSHFEYARDFPEEWAAAVGLCYRCWEQTTDESPGDMVTINVLFGTRFLNAGDPCPYCGSLVQTKWFCILFPIVLLGRYRVRNLGNDQYVGRKLKELVA